MNGLRQDLRYTLRALRKARGFALTTILTLALAIGGSTTIFTVVDSVLLRPLGFANPDRLTMIWTNAHSRVSEGYSTSGASSPDVRGHGRLVCLARDSDRSRRAPGSSRRPRHTKLLFCASRSVVLGRTFTASANFMWSRLKCS